MSSRPCHSGTTWALGGRSPGNAGRSTVSLLELFEQVELLRCRRCRSFRRGLTRSRRRRCFPGSSNSARLTAPFNPAGVPCTAQPIPAAGSSLPASLQLVGPLGSEELLVGAAARVEQAMLATDVRFTAPSGQH